MTTGRSHCLLAAALAAVAAFQLAGCDRSSSSRAAVNSTPAIARLVRQDGSAVLELGPGGLPGMTVVGVRKVAISGVLETTGRVTFDEQRVASIVSRVAGRIEQARAVQWDSVRRGEPIVKLYSPDFMTAEAEYLQAQETRRVSAAPAVAGGQRIAAAMVEAARRKLELLGMEPADVAALRAPSPTVWMRAPISGTVLKNQARAGMAVSPGDVLYQLGTLGDVWIVADIYEVDLARVHLGQTMEAATTAFPGEVFRGVISRISPDIDPNTHTLEIRCTIRNPGLKLKPQMLAIVRIVTSPSYALVVPQEALVFDTDGYYAFVRTSRGFERRKVTIEAWHERGASRVLSGLNAGEQVVAAESLQVNSLWHRMAGGNW